MLEEENTPICILPLPVFGDGDCTVVLLHLRVRQQSGKGNLSDT